VTRTLTAARAMVAPHRADAYRELLARRAEAARRRGANFWVFRSREEPDAFLEFTEAADGTAGARSSEEIALERQLRELATYGTDAEEVWEEFQLPHPARGAQEGSA
jgi:hypothetical protein